MVIEIFQLDQSQKIEFNFSANLSIPDGYYNLSDTGYTAEVSGKAYKAIDVYCVELCVSTELAAPCDRCLEPVKIPLAFQQVVRFARPGAISEADEQEFIALEERAIDIKALVADSVLAEIPMKILCDENCKGLCSACGHNLNLSECGCEADIDPRFEVLRSLL